MTKSGIEIPVRVNTMTGNFEATVGDEHLSAPTWAELSKQVERAAKRVTKSVAIPFTRLNPRVDRDGKAKLNAAHGTATGLHSENGNVLTRVNGSAVQLTKYERRQGEFYRPLTGRDGEEYRRLLEEAHRANQAVREWQKRNELDLFELVPQALNEAVKSAE